MKIATLLVLAVLAARSTSPAPGPAPSAAGKKPIERVVVTPEEWKKKLTPEQYRVLRDKGTERAFTGALWNEHAAGTYACVGCGLPLFGSDTKFDSGTGWPSYYAPLGPARVTEHKDADGERVEVVCARCDGHLGHVFPDGPEPTGLRYCINSVSLKFEKAAKKP